MKVERIFGKIPRLIQLVLEYNGFDTLLALKGIRWDDKKYFFEALEESIASIAEIDDADDEMKLNFIEECAANHQKLHDFKLKLGHKNLIINLCHELQKTNLEDFNGSVIQVPEMKIVHSELIVRKPEEHGYSRENERKRASAVMQTAVPEKIAKIEEQAPEQAMVQYLYETEEEDDNTSQFVEQEYLEELETYDDAELVEYQEIQPEEIETDDNCLYATEQIIKNEADQYEQAEYEISGYDSSSSQNRSGPKSKKPKHMYTLEFLQTQMTQGRIGMPGRRRPKIQKHYPDTEEGLLERWAGKSTSSMYNENTY